MKKFNVILVLGSFLSCLQAQADEAKSGLAFFTEFYTCSSKSQTCSKVVVEDLVVEVLEKSGISPGPVVASGKTNQEGKAFIPLEKGLYQVKTVKVSDTCPQGWAYFGGGCLGPAFGVSTSMQTKMKLEFVRWVD